VPHILNPDLTYRQIFLDGRALERAPNPSWMGYSVGHWERLQLEDGDGQRVVRLPPP
jgi:hypothetical protein